MGIDSGAVHDRLHGSAGAAEVADDVTPLADGHDDAHGASGTGALRRSRAPSSPQAASSNVPTTAIAAPLTRQLENTNENHTQIWVRNPLPIPPRPWPYRDAVATDVQHGLTSAEVADRVARGLRNDIPEAPTRTVAEIVKANLFTRFNFLVGSLLVIILIVGPLNDALFGGVVIANTLIGIIQELREANPRSPRSRQRAARPCGA